MYIFIKWVTKIMEPKAAGWIRIKQMIWGAGQHIMDKETWCALVRFIEIMEQGHHIEWKEWLAYLYHCWRICDEIYLNSEQGKVEFLRNYLFFPDDGLVFDGFFEDSVSAVILSRQKQLVRLLLGSCWIVWRVSWWRRNASQIPNTFWVAHR